MTDFVSVIKDPVLRENIKNSAIKIQKGFFNIFIIWGDTRAGKSTIARQMAWDLSRHLDVPFTAKDNIWFSSKEILDVGKQGFKKGIYILDEASFDGKGVDWQNKDQQNLIKLFNTAAKFNQTYFLLLPNLEELKYTFIRDSHSMGMQVTFDRATFDRGFFRLYNKAQFIYKYWALLNRRLSEAQDAAFAHQGQCDNECSFINMDEYEAKKDEAIARLGEEKEKESVETKSKYAQRQKELRENGVIEALRLNLLTKKQARKLFFNSDSEWLRFVEKTNIDLALKLDQVKPTTNLP